MRTDSMKADTRLFGKIEIEDEKILTFDQGIIGFPYMKHFALIFDVEDGKEAKIKWLQSMEEECFAMPVMEPGELVPDYHPFVSDETWQALGDIKDEDTLLLVTVTVPTDIEQMSINLKAPVVINLATNKAAQVIVEDDYPVKYKIYDKIKDGKRKEGE